MKISTKTTYGLRAVIYLANTAKDGRICSIKEIAASEKISPDYLEKIISKMEKAGILEAQKGVKGGYKLARPAKNIRLGEIVNVLEGESHFVQCVSSKDNICPNRERCLAKNFWAKFQNKLNEFLDSITLEQIINNDL
ncbi:MAG: Rrf2 family transcriptional regulator [Candidatus Paceibacterota bacterium]|jgi:Rrf2 family protein